MGYIMATVSFPVPLTLEAYQQAKKLSIRQSHLQKAEQVYFNTLAVYAVNSYLECMGIETDLAASDSQEPIMLLLSDTADLIIKNIGKIECRPVLENEEFVRIPLDVWENRIGYIAVQINEPFKEATLLGFVEEVETEEIPINQLQSLEKFWEYLDTYNYSMLTFPDSSVIPLENLNQVPVSTNQSVSLTETVGDVLQRIFNTFAPSWQKVESLLGIESPYLVEAWRSIGQLQVSPIERPARGFMRAKLIDFNSQVSDPQVALIVALMPAVEPEEIDILVEIRPTLGYKSLPPELQLMVLDQTGAIGLYAQPKEHDPTIQFEFSVKLGETFSIKLILGDMSYTKQFII